MEQLFSGFKQSSAAEWKNQLMKELKGEDYETLRWHNDNGFVIEPFYTSEDIKQAYLPAFSHCDWAITVNGKHNDAGQLNKQFLSELNMGAGAISMQYAGQDLDVALKDVGLAYIHSSFFVDAAKASTLVAWLCKHPQAHDLNVSLFPLDLRSESDLAKWQEAIEPLKNFSNIKCHGVKILPFHNLNCTASYEVAIAMSALTEHLEFLSKSKRPLTGFAVKTGVSSDYFVQMAKLRAVRRLWDIIRKEYDSTADIYVIAETSLTNKSISDSYNNLLRTTVEAMAAVSGGCNELVVNGFDILFAKDAALANRMAINQQLVLKHESYFDKMADVACGSYYIENLTDAIAREALGYFKNFEKEGGYFKCLEKGLFATSIKEQAQQRQSELDRSEKIAIGINKFRNEKEKISLSAEQISGLKKQNINNPLMNYELQNFFGNK